MSVLSNLIHLRSILLIFLYLHPVLFYWCFPMIFPMQYIVFLGRVAQSVQRLSYRLDGPGIESRWVVRFSAPVQTGPGAHTASCTMGTGSFPGVNSGRGVTLTTHPLLVPLVMKEQSYTSTPPMGRNRACNGVTVPFSLYLFFPFPSMLHVQIFACSCIEYLSLDCTQRERNDDIMQFPTLS